jgi:hypothetical protein
MLLDLLKARKQTTETGLTILLPSNIWSSTACDRWRLGLTGLTMFLVANVVSFASAELPVELWNAGLTRLGRSAN